MLPISIKNVCTLNVCMYKICKLLIYAYITSRKIHKKLVTLQSPLEKVTVWMSSWSACTLCTFWILNHVNVLLIQKNNLKKVPRILAENEGPSTSCSNPFLPQVLKIQTIMLEQGTRKIAKRQRWTEKAYCVELADAEGLTCIRNSQVGQASWPSAHELIQELAFESQRQGKAPELTIPGRKGEFSNPEY